jgi:hypothetical protein
MTGFSTFRPLPSRPQIPTKCADRRQSGAKSYSVSAKKRVPRLPRCDKSRLKPFVALNSEEFTVLAGLDYANPCPGYPGVPVLRCLLVSIVSMVSCSCPSLDQPCIRINDSGRFRHCVTRTISESSTSRCAAKLTCCGAGRISLFRMGIWRCASATLRAELSKCRMVSLNDLPPPA